MKAIISIAFLLASLNSLSQQKFDYYRDFQKIQDETKKSTSKLNYEKQLKRFVAFDTTLTEYEVLALLIGFTGRSEYKPYEDIEKEKAIFSLNEQGKYNEALLEATEFLKSHPLSLKTLFEKEYSFRKLNSDSAQDYNYLGISILVAMNFSGNGTNPNTAMFALGPSDGQLYIHRVVKAKIGKMASGKDSHGNFLDILEAIKNGETRSFYFNIQHAIKTLRTDLEKAYDEVEKTKENN